MFRYVAFVWDPGETVQCESARTLARVLRSETSDWQRVVRLDGLEVFCADLHPGQNQALVLPDEGGVIVGALFEHPAHGGVETRRKTSLSPIEATRIVGSGGRHLIESYWGRYVAFLADRVADRRFILRDPTGALECLTVEYRGVHVYFSGMSNCPPLDLLTYTVDWEYVHAHLCGMLMETRKTGLQQVTRILRGECVKITSNRVDRSFYWHPFRVAETEPIEDPELAARELRRVVKAAVHAWASCYDNIMLLLSGGLDSSIVLGCVRDAPTQPQVSCLNYFYSEDSENDERTFARIAARAAGQELIEHRISADFPLSGALRVPRYASPWNFVPDLGANEFEALLCARYGAKARFRGFGGDQLFYQSGARFACADLLFRRSSVPALFTTALNAARVNGRTVWKEIWGGLQGRFGDSMSGVLDLWTSASSPLISPSIVEVVRHKQTFLHPWFHDAGKVPPGKRWHISLIAVSEDMQTPFAPYHDAEDVSPLFSQPVIDVCLRIPTDVLLHDGWDRSIARRAFVHDVPMEILRRRSKGDPSLHGEALLRANLSYLREVLLDGVLVRNNVLDRERLEAVLQGNPTQSFGYPAELFSYLSTEIWLTQWHQTAQRRAA